MTTPLTSRVRRAIGGLLVVVVISVQVHASPPVGTATPAVPTASVNAADHGAKRADFGHTGASREARQVADWVVHSGDNDDQPFVIVDKREATVFVFDAQGKLAAATPALLGLAIGDRSTPGIGTKKLSAIRPHERTTPAGRFVANLDKNLQGHDMLWVDYDTAVSMHPVVAGQPRERRAQRLASPSPSERRISYGCINIPARFFEQVIRPAFTGTNGIVYVLPEVQGLRDVFGAYEGAALETR